MVSPGGSGVEERVECVDEHLTNITVTVTVVASG